MATTKTTVRWRTSTGSPVTTEFGDATAKIVDGCLVITSEKIAEIFAPGQWLRAWTEKVDG